MNTRKHTRIARSLMLVVCSSFAYMAHAQETAAALLKDWTFSGHYDIYFQYDGNRPGSGFGSVTGRQFDTANNQFSLAVLQLSAVKKPTADNPVGFTIDLIYGKNADIIAGADPDGGSSKMLQQAFVTYQPPKCPVTFDLGKFLTWIGYEGVDSSGDDNYSRSFLFTYAEPIYHTGIRAGYTATKTLGLNAYLVNGWNETDDSNAAKSYGATAAWTPTAKLAVTTNYYGGVEKGSGGLAIPGGGGNTAVELGDLVATYQFTDKLKLALNGDYADAKAEDTGGPSGHWSGLAAYLIYQLTPKYGLAVRGETDTDPNGLRSGLPGRYESLTGTLNISGPGNAMWRVEVRYDKSNLDVFASDNGPKDNQITYTFAHVLKF